MKPNKILFIFNVLVLIMVVSCVPISNSFTQAPEQPVTISAIPSQSPILPTPTLIPTSFLATPRITPTYPTIPPSPTITPTIFATPELTELVMRHGTLAQFYTVYTWGEVQTLSQNQQITAIHYEPHIIDFRNELVPNPVSSVSFSFSNYSDQLAYWSYEYPSTLWVSDIRLQNPQAIFVDSNGLYVPEDLLSAQDLRLFWSPDDQHIIIYSPNPEIPHLIYHLNSGKVDEWYWSCDSVFISPRTDRFALLCPLDLTKKHLLQEMYAVIEWEGEIWFTSSLPLEIVSQPLPDENKTIPWSFSPDGQQLAYFDPLDTTNSLWITDATGHVISLLPTRSILQPNKDLLAVGIESPYYYGVYRNKFFRWSPDGQLLAVVALDNETNDYCKPLIGIEGEFYIPPCWQVVDLSVGKVMWSETSSIETLFLTDFERQRLRVDDIDFSPDGTMIIVHGDRSSSEQLLAIIDLRTFIAYRLTPLQYAKIYWGE